LITAGVCEKIPPMTYRKPDPRREAVKIVLLAGLATLFFCILFKDRWPKAYEFLPETAQDPVQTREDVPEPFDAEQKGFTYTITPLFSYELWGMVVSMHDASSFLDVAHEAWKDYLNVKDLCVIWGRNLETDAFRHIKFRNRDFTCYYSWSTAEAGELFSGSHISNNHLITPDAYLRRIIKSVKRGDQIRFRGWLANYGHKGSNTGRATSTSRNDKGDHACETVYVTEFEILKRANPGWRAAFPISLILIAGSLALLFLF
jgi:hypothetical protein